jgi:hypothetical protein
MSDQAALIIVELAKEFIELVRNMEPRWSNAYYRFRSEGTRYGSNASYVVNSGAVLISAMKNAAFYARMNEKGARLLSAFNKEKGVFLLIAKANFEYDVKFEWEDLHRWEITKINGGTGVPVGI